MNGFRVGADGLRDPPSRGGSATTALVAGDALESKPRTHHKEPHVAWAREPCNHHAPLGQRSRLTGAEDRNALDFIPHASAVIKSPPHLHAVHLAQSLFICLYPLLPSLRPFYPPFLPTLWICIPEEEGKRKVGWGGRRKNARERSIRAKLDSLDKHSWGPLCLHPASPEHQQSTIRRDYPSATKYPQMNQNETEKQRLRTNLTWRTPPRSDSRLASLLFLVPTSSPPSQDLDKFLPLLWFTSGLFSSLS